MRFENNGNRVVSEWEEDILFDADDPDFCNSTALHSSNVLRPPTLTNIGYSFKVPTTAAMSLASIHGPQYADLCSLGHNSLSVSSSLSDLVGSPLEISMDNVLTIEELRAQMGSCFSCGVSWTDDHVSLDCTECGGYSLERPCPLCDGKCGVQWKRDFTMSHACSKARWLGVCPSYPESTLNATTQLTAPIGTAQATSNMINDHINNNINNNNNNNNNNVNNASNIVACAAAAAAVAATANSNANKIVCGTANQLLLAQELCARLEQLSASAQT